MSIIHVEANRMLQCYLDADREGWKEIRGLLPAEIREFVLDLEKRQRLMFEFNDFRYLSWCTVRPNKNINL